MTKLRRIYSGSDSYMLETSSVMHKLFVDQLADFTAFDITLSAAFAQEWLLHIEDAYQLESDILQRNLLSQKTEETKRQIKICHDKYAEVKFFAQKAFKENKAVCNEFVFETYAQIYKNKSKLMLKMAVLYETCLSHQAALTAQGLSAASINEIKSIGEELLRLSTEQNDFKKAKRVSTESRISALNACYSFSKTVMNAARIVYKEDQARKQMFLYQYKPKQRSTNINTDKNTTFTL